MLNRRNRARGVTIIELMIAIAIIALLMVAGVPTYQQWIQNTQLRTAAETIQNGLQLARATAVRDNTSTRFMFTGAGNISSWTVDADDQTTPAVVDFTVPVQARDGTEGSAQARVGTSIPVNTTYGTPLAPNAAGTVVFNGVGRVVPGGITRIDVLHPTVATARRLVITISLGGQIRMCDPALALTLSPQACA